MTVLMTKRVGPRAVTGWRRRVDVRASDSAAEWAIRRILFTGYVVAPDTDLDVEHAILATDVVIGALEYPGVYAVVRGSRVVAIATARWRSPIAGDATRP